MLVGKFLDLLLGTLEFILRDDTLFLKLLGAVHGLPAAGTDTDTRLFGQLVDRADKVLAALLRELGNTKTDQLAIDSGVNADIALLNGALDILDGSCIKGLDHEQAGFGSGNESELLQLHAAAIGGDVDIFYECRGCFPGSDGVELMHHEFYGFFHAGLGIKQDFFCAHGSFCLFGWLIVRDKGSHGLPARRAKDIVGIGHVENDDRHGVVHAE